MFPPQPTPVHTLIDTFADILMLGAGAGTIIFVLSYAFFFNWRKTPAGRSVFWFMVSLASLLLYIILSKTATNIWGPNYWGRDVERFVIYAFPFIMSWRLVATLWSNWRKGGKLLELERRMHRNTGPIASPLPRDGENTLS